MREKLNKNSDIAINASADSSRRIRFGFGGRLLLAFGIVAVTTVAAGLVAWIVFASLSNAIDRIQVQHLPAITISAELAQKGGAVIATAPQLIAAQTNNQRERVWSQLEVLLLEMTQLTQTAPEITTAKETAAQLHQLMTQIADNLVALDLQVQQRFLLAELLTERTDRLRWLHTDFLDEIDPMVEDARFNLASALERIDTAATQKEMANTLSVLKEETRRQEAMLKINASGNLAVGLLVRGSSAPDSETLSDTIHFHAEVSTLLKDDLTHLKGITSGISLQQISREIMAFGHGNTGIFSIRKKQLEVLQEANQLLKRNQELVEKLKSVITAQVKAAQEASTAAVQKSNALIGRGKLMLAGAMIAGLVVAILVGWLYVGRSLVARVTALSKSMRAIAHGDLKATIPTGGRDEISVMADALLVFRDTAIEVEEANAQAIIDNAQAGLVTTDEDGVIEFFNPTAMALFGYGPDQKPANRLDELIVGEQRHLIASFFHSPKSNTQDKLLPLETMGKRSDATTFPMDMAVCAFRQRQQRKYIVTLYDITERKEAQAILENRVRERTADFHRAIEQLQQEITERRRAEAVLKETQADLVQAAKLAALGQMAAGIAHELNQPLTAIRSYTHNVGRLIGMGRTGAAADALERINLLTERMADISKRLKNLARRPTDKTGAVDLKKALHNALALFDSHIRKQNVTVVLNLPEENCRVFGETVRMEQICVNVISNALDAMQTSRIRKLTISVDLQTQHQQVRVTFTDTGIGIPAVQLDSVFDPFFTTKEVGQGLGLGLSISYNIIKDWGGSIKVSSTPGQGTSFVLILKTG